MPVLGRAEGGDSGLAESAGDRLGLDSGTTATQSLCSACGPAMTPTRLGPGRRHGDCARRAPALPGGSPTPRLPDRCSARGRGCSYLPWLSSSGPAFLRVSPRTSHPSCGTEATWEWEIWGPRATSVGMWPWRRGAELELGGRGRAAAAGLRLRLSKRKRNYSRHLRQLARLSRPSLPPSRRPPPCEELLRLGPGAPGCLSCEDAACWGPWT